VQIVEQRQGLKIACLEEDCVEIKAISTFEPGGLAQAKPIANTEYGRYPPAAGRRLAVNSSIMTSLAHHPPLRGMPAVREIVPARHRDGAPGFFSEVWAARMRMRNAGPRHPGSVPGEPRPLNR